jgi:hypothetical protein
MFWIVRNRYAYEFLRSSAMEAFKLGIACGDLSREEDGVSSVPDTQSLHRNKMIWSPFHM